MTLLPTGISDGCGYVVTRNRSLRLSGSLRDPSALDLPDDEAAARSFHDGLCQLCERVDLENSFRLCEKTVQATGSCHP